MFATTQSTLNNTFRITLLINNVVMLGTEWDEFVSATVTDSSMLTLVAAQIVLKEGNTQVCSATIARPGTQ